jgi:hypothetical protein
MLLAALLCFLTSVFNPAEDEGILVVAAEGAAPVCP